MRQLNALQSLVELILDRSAALCPSYLVLDDMQKRLSAQVGQTSLLLDPVILCAEFLL